MSKPTYWELLRRPEWQRKRLEVMQRAGFACEHCSATDQTLNVHHRHYRKGAAPWEYDLAELVCLCEGCHGEWHAAGQSLKEAVGQLSSWWVGIVTGFAKGMILHEQSPSDTKVRLDHEAESYGMSDAYKLSMDGAMGPLAVWAARDEHGCVDDEAMTRLVQKFKDEADAAVTWAAD